MRPVKVSFPHQVYDKFMGLARTLGYTVRGQRWKLLDMLLDYADEHPNSFRKR